jgi:DNA processing protein
MSPSADTQEQADWMRLVLTPGLGRRRSRELLARTSGVSEALQGLESQPGHEVPPAHDSRIQAALHWLSQGPDRHFVTLGDPHYPPALLHSPDPPLLLFGRGNWAHLSSPCVAMVGSRQATAAALALARRWSSELACAGWLVGSGLARGVDAMAHQGALDAGAPTLAVVGHGPDRIYPSGHRSLADAIAATGLLISEYLPGTPAVAAHFPQRNRILAGLCRGVVVVEAALASGSLITARLAMESGREVMAVPGALSNPQSAGCHALIKQGAALVESPQDVLETLSACGHAGPPARGLALEGRQSEPARQGQLFAAQAEASEAPVGAPGQALLRALGHEVVGFDNLAQRCGAEAPALNAQLLELELMGWVERLPGSRFQRGALAPAGV